MYLLKGQQEPAEGAYKQALVLLKPLTEAHPWVPQYQYDLATTYYHMGILHHTRKQRDQARAAFRQAVEIQAKLAREYSDKPEYGNDLATHRSNLAATIYSLGYASFHTHRRMDQAEAAYREAADLWDQLVREYPQVRDYRYQLARSRGSLGMVRPVTGHGEQAKALYDQALRILEALVGEKHENVSYVKELAVTYGLLGDLARDAKQLPHAADWYGKAALALEKILRQDPKHPAAPLFLHNMRRERALTLLGMGEHARAEAEAEALVARSPAGTDSLLTAARVFALSYVAAKDHAKLSQPQREELANRYGARAVDLLRLAAKKGSNNADKLRADQDLRSLRGRDDFKELLGELERQTKPPSRGAGSNRRVPAVVIQSTAFSVGRPARLYRRLRCGRSIPQGCP